MSYQNSNMPTKEQSMKWIRTQIPTLIGVVAGGILGYLYYLQYGCTTDACPITANPYKTTALFGIMGGLLGSSFQTKKKDEK